MRRCILGAAPPVCPAPTFEPDVGPELLPELVPFCLRASASSIFALAISSGVLFSLIYFPPFLLNEIAPRSALTSDSLYLRWPPKVLMEVNFPAFAHLVTVFGSTRNSEATSAGVSKTSCSILKSRLYSITYSKCPLCNLWGKYCGFGGQSKVLT